MKSVVLPGQLYTYNPRPTLHFDGFPRVQKNVQTGHWRHDIWDPDLSHHTIYRGEAVLILEKPHHIITKGNVVFLAGEECCWVANFYFDQYFEPVVKL